MVNTTPSDVLWFLEGKRGFQKVVSADNVAPVPLQRNVTTHVEAVDWDDLETVRRALEDHSLLGRALVRGPMSRALSNESRVGAAERLTPSNWICLDVDGLRWPEPLPPTPYDADDLANMASAFMESLFPGEWPDCLAHASSSCGRREGIMNLHVFTPLEEPIAPTLAKAWLRQLNLNSPLLLNSVELTDSGVSLRWPLDPALADNSRLIFLAPAVFNGVADPFPLHTDRWATVAGSRPRLRTPTAEDIDFARLKDHETGVVSTLRKKRGLSRRTAVTTIKRLFQEEVEVLTNPDAMHIEIVDDTNADHVRCNVNGGDSRAYYYYRADPRWMLNFKGEPAFPLEKANKDFFRLASERREAGPPPNVSGPQPLVVRDPDSDAYYAGLFNTSTNTYDPDYGLKLINKANLRSFFASHGVMEPPDTYYDAFLEFDPRKGESPVETGERPWRINTFRYSRVRREAVPHGDAEDRPSLDNNGPYRRTTPMTWRVMEHAMGSEEDADWFLNWLAFIHQTGEKSMTAWLISGGQGTGKGLLANRILTPLFGQRQCLVKELGNIEEQFNGYLRTAQMLIVDEFRVNSTVGSVVRLADRLKAQITEPTITIREMRANQVVRPSFVNFIFLTNHHDAVRIGPDDRRYHVSKRRDRKLTDRFGTGFDEDVPLLKDELTRFAGLLSAHRVDAHAARHPRMNRAKLMVIRGSTSFLEELVEAVRDGDLTYFAEVVDMDVALTPHYGGSLPQNRTMVRGMYFDAARGGGAYSVLSMHELRSLYHLISQQYPQLMPKIFKNRLEAMGFPATQHALPDGRRKRGVRVNWAKETQMEALRRIKEEKWVAPAGPGPAVGAPPDLDSNVIDMEDFE